MCHGEWSQFLSSTCQLLLGLLTIHCNFHRKRIGLQPWQHVWDEVMDFVIIFESFERLNILFTGLFMFEDEQFKSYYDKWINCKAWFIDNLLHSVLSQEYLRIEIYIARALWNIYHLVTHLNITEMFWMSKTLFLKITQTNVIEILCSSASDNVPECYVEAN